MEEYEERLRQQAARKGRSASICVPPPDSLQDAAAAQALQAAYQLSRGKDSPKRNAARRSKSERLQGIKPRVKKRAGPIDQVPSGSEKCISGGFDEQESYNPFLKRIPSTGRLLGMSDSAGALVFSEDSPRSGSPTRQKRFQRPPMPLTPGDSPRQTPRTARSRSYYRHPTKSSEFNRRSQKNLDSCGDDDDDAYRMRNFSLTPKGVVNRGDSFRRRRSRSSSLVPGTRLAFTDDEPLTVENIPNSASDDEAAKENRSSYVVAMLGALGVGKGALLNQFMTSEHVNPYEGTEGGGDENEKNIFVTMDGEETELTFRTIRSVKTDIDRTNPPKAIIVVYSVVDKSSFNRAHDELKHLENMELTTFRTVIVVGNKIDLARSRAVSTQGRIFQPERLHRGPLGSLELAQHSGCANGETSLQALLHFLPS